MKGDRYFYSEEKEKKFLKRKVALVHKRRLLGRFNTLATQWKSRYILVEIQIYTILQSLLCIQYIQIHTISMYINLCAYTVSMYIYRSIFNYYMFILQIYIATMYTSTYSMYTSMYIHLCIDVLCIVHINIHCSHYFLHLNMFMSQSLFSSQHTKSSTSSPLCIMTIYFLQRLMAVGNVACVRLENELLPFYKHVKESQFCPESNGKP